MTEATRKVQLQCWAGEAQATVIVEGKQLVGFQFTVEQLEVYFAQLADKAVMLAQFKKNDPRVPPGWVEANVVEPIRSYFGRKGSL